MTILVLLHMPACKACGGIFSWAKIGQRWRLVKANGKRHRCFVYRKQKREPAHEVGPHVVGEGYRPSCGKCGLPPWQACMCSEIDRAINEVNAEADQRFERMLDLLDA